MQARRFILSWVLTVTMMLVASVSHADDLVFGSFRSSQNANNWAQKLSHLFNQPLVVKPFVRDDVSWYRVQTENFSDTQVQAVARRADAAGIQHWRIYANASPASVVDSLVDKQTASSTAAVKPSSSVIRPGRGATPTPRLSPPSRVTPLPAEDAQDKAEYTKADQTPPRQPRQSDFDWQVGLQTRVFNQRGVQQQGRYEASVSLQFEYYTAWDDDRQSVTITPFLRKDSADSHRTQADFRELFYSRVGDNWDLHIGARRIFWGVTEFHHLIDVINQTDLVENIDTEDKLGQPMVHLSLIRDWGIVDVYALAGFRERTFPGPDGRLRLPLRIVQDSTYASAAEDKRIDMAIRWSHHMGPIEVGVHHFSGTSREPMFLPLLDTQGNLYLSPHYTVIDQTGIDAQAFVGEWVFKLEGFSRSGFGDRYAAVNLGVERTLVGVFGSRADLGLVAEYMYDERGEGAFNTLFENDIALGGRFAFNDFADTQALLGVIIDTRNDEYMMSLEASRRLGDNWFVSLEGRLFNGGESVSRASSTAQLLLDPDFKSSWLQRDDFFQLELTRFF